MRGSRTLVAALVLAALPAPRAAAQAIALSASPSELVEQAERLVAAEKYEEAFPLLERAMGAGEGRAYYVTGTLYQRGLGVDVDHERARAMHYQAAKRGYSPAMVTLGFSALHGYGTKADPKEALGWFQRADAAGHVDGALWLGVMLRDGTGVGRDLAAAEKFLMKALRLGSDDAPLELAALKGGGPGADPAEAYSWLIVASQAGDARRAKAWDKAKPLEARIDEASRKKAREKAAELFQKHVLPRSQNRMMSSFVRDPWKELRGTASNEPAKGKTGRYNYVNLTALRDAAKAYRKANGRRPSKLSELAPFLESGRVPTLVVGEHPAAAAETVYDGKACAGGRSDRVSPSRVGDTGRWGLAVAEGWYCDGAVFIDCTHRDPAGKRWADY